MHKAVHMVLVLVVVVLLFMGAMYLYQKMCASHGQSGASMGGMM